MRKSTGILLSISLVLIAIILVFKVRVPFGRSNAGFSVDWVDDIKSITIRDKDDTLVLERNGQSWQVNKSFVARKSAVAFLLKNIAGIEIKSPVSDDLFRDLVDIKKQTPVKVLISGKNKTAEYLIYKSSDQSYGSIFRKSTKSKPFFVSLPSYGNDPGNSFVTDEKYWMPYYIFKLEPDNIRSINISYKDPGMDDISIIRGEVNNSFFINGKESLQANQEKIRRYITYFTFVPFEAWASELDPVYVTEIISTEPEIIIKVLLKTGSEVVARLWTRMIDTPQGLSPDTDRLFGTIDGARDIFIAKYFDVDPLIKSAQYFISD
jgi:hypothetical protein